MKHKARNIEVCILLILVVAVMIFGSYFVLQMREEKDVSLVTELSRTHDCKKTDFGYRCKPYK